MDAGHGARCPNDSGRPTIRLGLPVVRPTNKLLSFSLLWLFTLRFFSATYPFGFSVSLRRGLPRTDPTINDIFIESPDSSNPDSRDDTLGGVSADGDFVEFQPS